MGESAYYAVDVAEASARLQESPERVREMLATGELEGIPPGATAQGDWKVLLPATPELEQPAPGTPAEEPPGTSPEEGDDAPPETEPPETEPPETEPPDTEPPDTEPPDTEPPESGSSRSTAEQAAEAADAFVAPPADAGVAAVGASREPSREPSGETLGAPSDESPSEPFSERDEGVRGDVGESGWTTTKQAAKVLGVSRRSVQGYVRRGLLEAREEGEGVNKTFLVSIDSLGALRDRRSRERGEAAKGAVASAEEERPTNLRANTSEALRHAIDRVEARTAEATELRVRLEITEKAESTLRAELEEERRRREAAERERDELRRQLEGRPEEPREAPASPTPATPAPQTAAASPDPQPRTVVEEPRANAGGPQGASQGGPQQGRRRSLWRRVFGG